MKWVITGGCGFIGRSLIAHLISDKKHCLRVLDNLSVGSREDLAGIANVGDAGLVKSWNQGQVDLWVGDIRDRDFVTDALVGADVVIHLAANTGVGPSVDNPYMDCEVNVIGTLNVLEAARKTVGQRVVFASSGAPLGVQNPPLHEELAPHPASPYGASKLGCEGYCSAYYHCFGVETTVLRFGNVYGPGSGHKTSVVAKFIRQAMAGEVLEIYGDGSQTRDFIYVDDLVAAIYAAATVENIGGEIFQIATSRETTVHELTDALISALVAEGIGKPEISFGPSRTGDVARNFSDTSKALARLGWKAEVALRDGLTLTIKSFFKSEGR